MRCAIDPVRPDVMYAGTGEGYFREEIRGTGLPLRGAGIYMTTQRRPELAAAAAQPPARFSLGERSGARCRRLRRVYAATRSGVWRSIDNGASWSRLLAVNVRGGCLELAMRPDRNEDVLFASCGSYEQATVYRFPRAGDDRTSKSSSANRTWAARRSRSRRRTPTHVRDRGQQRSRGRRQLRQACWPCIAAIAAATPVRGRHASPIQTRNLNTMLLTNIASVFQPHAQSAEQAALHRTWAGTSTCSPSIRAIPNGSGRRASTGSARTMAGETGDWRASTAAPLPSHATCRPARHRVPSAVRRRQNQVALIGNDGGIYRTDQRTRRDLKRTARGLQRRHADPDQLAPRSTAAMA